MQRLQLQNHRKLGRTANFMFDDVAGYLCRQREWESHSFLTDLGDGCRGTGLRHLGPVRLRLGLEQPGQKKIQRRNALRRINATTTSRKHQQGDATGQPEHFPL